MPVRRPRFLLFLFAFTALVLLSPVKPAHAQQRAGDGVPRFALVIGNAAYKSGPLVNPLNDARAMAARLREFGFDVTLHENLRIRDIGSVYRGFRTKIVPGATALVFYAGHGVQVKGQNYFPAVDAEISSEEDVPLQSLHLGTLLENMEEAKAGVSLVFLDACRDNPFARRFRSGSRGLAKVEAASGTLIHYATKPGSVADDGDGRNGTYTDALLREMGAPGLPVELMLKQVTNQVVTRTKGKQEPWIEGSLRGDFYFNGKAATGVAAPPAVAADPAANERAVWEAVKSSRNADEIRAFLVQFPSGIFSGVAQARLSALAAPPVQVESTGPNAPDTQPAVASRLIAAMTPGTVFRDCAECPEMVVIPAGSFSMGSPESEQTRRDTEGPQHRVSISRPFAAGKFEVTFDEWDACVREGGCQYQAPDNTWGRGKRPVINVSWQDAKAYTEWLSRKTGHRYRLPSEAEWEYAARAGTATAFSTGDRISPQQANFNTSVSYAGSAVATPLGSTTPVGSYPANAFGLHDMHGNVWEWTEDCYNSSYKGAPTDGAVWSSGDCSQRMVRGGSWSVNPQILRSAFRSLLTLSVRNYYDFGFRVWRIDPEPAGNKPSPGVPASQAMTQPVQVTTSVANAHSGAASQPLVAMKSGSVFRDCTECPEMVVIPAGSFNMGSPESEQTRRDNEGPLHRVSMARPFAAGKFEVTFDEWDACVRDGGCQYPAPDNGWGRGRRPVVNVSWQDAKAYTEWLSRKTGHRYRLPSEAEWEYAARAGTATAFSTGDRITPQQASYNHSVSYAGSAVAALLGGTTPVGSYPANAFGLHDMHGNVWEWTEDCFNGNYSGAPTDGAVWSSGNCALRMLRGGSLGVYPQFLRSAFRSWLTPLIRNFSDFGFRVFRIDSEPAGNKPSLAVPASNVTTPPVQVTSSVANSYSGAALQALAAVKPGTVFRDCPECPEMVVIPAGKFMMGSPATEERRFPNEGPQRSVSIPKPLALGRFEVTRAEFARFVQEVGHSMGPGCTIARPVPPTPPPHPPRIVRNDPSHDWQRPGYAQSDNHPVTCVSWDDARAYAEWLSRKSGKRYRLPSEAEWEYAARAGSSGPFSFGARITPQQANYYTLMSYGGSPVAPLREATTPVGSYPANAFGLHDMHGNLFEWVEDCLNHNYDGAPTDGTAWTSGDCSVRMMRGGFYGEGPVWLRSAKRDGAYAVARSQQYGFRVARVD